MNILVPDSWLREHLKTRANPKQVAEDLSLCGQSVEKTTKVGEDYVYEIEITTNRPDCFSVYGIARELSAILPRFGLPAKLKPIQNTEYRIQNTENNLPLHVQITNLSSCPRFTALAFDDIKMGPSPKVIQDRLEKSGVRALNNVVDISNYLMLELGQPMHTFDYDKIKRAKMILREAEKGEKIVTLDGQTRNLPPGTIIIEDGEGRIIDLCGIMGGENSAVDTNTKRVLLFIQTYDPARIRGTCQLMGFRTEAASRFEKGVDPEGVMIAMKKAVLMFQENCGARVASNLIDVYPKPPKQKTVNLSQEKLNQVMGIKIKPKEAQKILESLGFQSTISAGQRATINATVPHWRAGDVSIPEDLIEEIARVYGYHNLPSALPIGQIPQYVKNEIFIWMQKVRNTFKSWGFTETFNYSIISEQNLKKMGLQPSKYLKLANPLTEEWVYLRPSLIPSLLEVAAKNQNEFEKIQIFELANIYLPVNNHTLPNEIPMLCGAITQTDFYQIKGVMEALLSELGIKDLRLDPPATNGIPYTSHAAQLITVHSPLGTFGEVDPEISTTFGIKQKIFLFELNFSELIKYATKIRKYVPVPQYPPIIEDFSFVMPPKVPVGELIQSIKSASSIVESVEFLDAYEDTRTFRVVYHHPQKTLTDKEVGKIREKIIRLVEKKFGAKIKA